MIPETTTSILTTTSQKISIFSTYSTTRLNPNWELTKTTTHRPEKSIKILFVDERSPKKVLVDESESKIDKNSISIKMLILYLVILTWFVIFITSTILYLIFSIYNRFDTILNVEIVFL